MKFNLPAQSGREGRYKLFAKLNNQQKGDQYIPNSDLQAEFGNKIRVRESRKITKSAHKNYFFKTASECNRVRNSLTPRGLSRTLTKFMY